MQVLIKPLNDTLRYNDLAEAYGGYGMVFFVEENRYMIADGLREWKNVLRVWLTDHNIENYEIGKRIITIDSRLETRAMARIIAAVNPKMAKRMADSIKNAIRAEGLRADTPIDVVDRQRGSVNVNGPREA